MTRLTRHAKAKRENHPDLCFIKLWLGHSFICRRYQPVVMETWQGKEVSIFTYEGQEDMNMRYRSIATELCWIMECYQTVRNCGERAPCCLPLKFFTHFSVRPCLVQTAWHIILNPAIVLHTLHWKGRTMKNLLLPKVLRNDISTRKRWSIRGLPTFPTFIRPIESSGTWI